MIDDSLYCFEAPDDCFISYESAPAAWTLDDGSRPPPRKPFLRPSYDAASRTFTGSVDWSGGTINGEGETAVLLLLRACGECRVGLGGDARWEYQLVFSESMNVIEGGGARGWRGGGGGGRLPRTLLGPFLTGGSWCYGEDGGLRAHRTFPDNLVYWRRPLLAPRGLTLPSTPPAMNRRALPAASSPRGLSFLQGSRVGLASYHFGPSGDGAEGSHISYAAADPSWRLDDGSAPPPRVPFLEPTYDAVTRACRGASSPANLGGSSAVPARRRALSAGPSTGRRLRSTAEKGLECPAGGVDGVSSRRGVRE